MGVQAFHQKNYEVAKQSLFDAIQQNPDVPENYWLLGQTCFYLESFQEAIPYFSEYVERTKQCPDKSCNRSQAYFHLGQCYEEHIKSIQQNSTPPEKDLDDAYKAAIQFYYQAKNAASASEQLRKAIEVRLTECLAQNGHRFYKKNDIATAQRCYLQAVKVSPDHFIALNQLGLCYMKKELYKDARDSFRDIINRTRHTQTQADAWYHIAITYRLQNKLGQAANALQKAKKLAPTDNQILQEEQELRLLVSSSILNTSELPLLFQNRSPTPQPFSAQNDQHEEESFQSLICELS